MKLLLDISIAAPVREKLAAAGHDVACVADRPKGITATDSAVLEQALRSGRVLVTLDKTIGEHELINGLPYRILRLSNFRVTEQAAAILLVLSAHGEEIENGAVVTVEPGQLRIRPAPGAR